MNYITRICLFLLIAHINHANAAARQHPSPHYESTATSHAAPSCSICNRVHTQYDRCPFIRTDRPHTPTVCPTDVWPVPIGETPSDTPTACLEEGQDVASSDAPAACPKESLRYSKRIRAAQEERSAKP